MKCLVLYFIFAIYSTSAVYHYENMPSIKPRGMIENTINTTLNKFKEKLLDPLVIASVPLDFGHIEELSGSLNISKLTISGVKEFLATEIKVQVFQQDFHIKLIVPEITAQFKYRADMEFFKLLPFYGQGRMSIIFGDIVVTVDAEAALMEGPKVKNIWLSITVNEAIFHLDGLLNDPEYSALISNVLNDNFANFINENPDIISRIISPIAQDITNHHLHQKEAIVEGVKVFVKKCK